MVNGTARRFCILTGVLPLLLLCCSPAGPEGGNRLHPRKDSVVEYYLNPGATDLTEVTVRETFQRWDDATHFTFIYKGRNRAGIVKDGKNTVSFLLTWPEEIPMKTAYCRNWYNRKGEIIESDIIFNMMIAGFTTTRTNRDGFYYIEGVLAHEIGHMIGLDHIEHPRSLMKAFSPVEESYNKGVIDDLTLDAYRKLYGGIKY